ncbi:unnamed protein product [Pieris macdunnoughi]|uniref:Ig-like domain-containing protein n=1 Tax=Pieris macdunnoughi TaxID=345717 RepID=A0A821LSN2_9NEOP|nr:unnamed protein product [Pieris macdunnoughi]
MGEIKKLLLLILNGYKETIALRDVQLIAPSAVKLGDTVLLGCKWTLEGNETLYSVKWYRGRQEFFSYLPKEYPFTRIFAQPGIDVDVSLNGFFFSLVLIRSFLIKFDDMLFHNLHLKPLPWPSTNLMD